MSQGFTIHTIVGGRVLGECTYVPAHTKNGKDNSQRITVPVRVNKRNREDDFELTIWGPLADTCARSCSPGKLLSVSGESQNYIGNLYGRDRQLRLDAAGQVIQIRKSATTVKHIMFGNESAKYIAKMIQEGRRGTYWNVPGHADNLQWQNQLAFMKANPELWDGASATFGFARIFRPEGAVLKPIVAAGVASGPVQVVQARPQVVQPTIVEKVAAVMTPQYVTPDGRPCDAQGNLLMPAGIVASNVVTGIPGMAAGAC